MDKIIKYRPTRTGARFHGSDQAVRFLMGPVGSGKTTSAIMECLTRVQEQEPNAEGVRNSRIGIIRNSYPILKSTTIKSWIDWIPESIFGPVRYDSPITHTLDYPLPDGTSVHCEVLFLSLDQEGDSKKLLSLELSFAWINEGKEIRRDMFDLLQTRCGRYPAIREGGATWAGVLIDSNPPSIGHWLYRLFVEEKPDQWGFFQQPPGDGPDAENIENLPDGYYQRLKAGKSDDWIRIYIQGQFGYTSDGKPVHPAFAHSLHVMDVEPLDYAKTFVGLDFGLTPAAAFVQWDAARGRYQVCDEIVTENMSAAGLATEIHRLVNRKYRRCNIEYWGDPAGKQRAQTDGQTVFDLLWAKGIDALPVDTNEFLIRKEALDALLTKLVVTSPAIVFSPTCRTLVQGLAGGYKFKRVQVSGDERYHEQPDKTRESHICEALHYALMGSGEGERVLAPENDWFVPDPPRVITNI